jgi:hypothetical protein
VSILAASILGKKIVDILRKYCRQLSYCQEQILLLLYLQVKPKIENYNWNRLAQSTTTKHFMTSKVFALKRDWPKV